MRIGSETVHSRGKSGALADMGSASFKAGRLTLRC
jgi:hypothetical protein